MSFQLTERANINQIIQSLIPNFSTSGIEIRNEKLVGDPRCAALFSGSEYVVDDPTAKFPSSGFVLGTGDANKLYNQDGTEASTNFTTPGDPDFDTTSFSTDACVIDFEFTCDKRSGGFLTVGYSFASDEYRDKVDENDGFADNFGFLLNGENIAKVPTTGEIVSVYTVNHINNTEFFEYNNPRMGQERFPGFEPDGFTKCMNATGIVYPGWNSMKIGIVDIKDNVLDSWVFLESQSFGCQKVEWITNFPSTSSVPSASPTLTVKPSKSPTNNPTKSPTPAPQQQIDFVPGPSPGGGGDPHFKTFDKQLFSYHGQCDMVLTSSKSYNNGSGLDVHVRTTRVDNDHINLSYSYISGAAVKIGSNIFEVNEDGDLIINGETSTPNAVMVFEGLQSITKQTKGTKKRISVYTFDLGDDKNIKIRVNDKNGMLFVDVNGAFGDSEGLLGSAPEHAKPLLARDGETDLSGHWNTYGEEWQVNGSDPKLFQDMTRHPQFPNGCVYEADRKNTNIRGSRHRRRLIEANQVSFEEATEACAHLNAQMKSFCVDDVMATGDLDLVEDPFYGN